jgi:hypothetical protein
MGCIGVYHHLQISKICRTAPMSHTARSLSLCHAMRNYCPCHLLHSHRPCHTLSNYCPCHLLHSHRPCVTRCAITVPVARARPVPTRDGGDDPQVWQTDASMLNTQSQERESGLVWIPVGRAGMLWSTSHGLGLSKITFISRKRRENLLSSGLSNSELRLPSRT